MKLKWVGFLFIMFFWSLYGCALLIPNHETKTKAEYHEDKEACDREARVYFEPLNIIGSDDERINRQLTYSRECLKKKGWRYFK